MSLADGYLLMSRVLPETFGCFKKVFIATAAKCSLIDGLNMDLFSKPNLVPGAEYSPVLILSGSDQKHHTQI